MAKHVDIDAGSKRRAKEQVEACVTQYVKMFPEEYAAFQRFMAEERAKLADQRFGEVRGMDSVDYLAHRMPENLYGAIYAATDGIGGQWLASDEGCQWFCKRYPQFRAGTEA